MLLIMNIICPIIFLNMFELTILICGRNNKRAKNPFNSNTAEKSYLKPVSKIKVISVVASNSSKLYTIKTPLVRLYRTIKPV